LEIDSLSTYLFCYLSFVGTGPMPACLRMEMSIDVYSSTSLLIINVAKQHLHRAAAFGRENDAVLVCRIMLHMDNRKLVFLAKVSQSLGDAFVSFNPEHEGSLKFGLDTGPVQTLVFSSYVGLAQVFDRRLAV
jgi:hypothetical protein